MKGSNLHLDLFSELTQCIKKTEARHKKVTEQRTKERNKLSRRVSGEIDHQKEWKREYAGVFPPLPRHKISKEANASTNNSYENSELKQRKSTVKSQYGVTKSDLNHYIGSRDVQGTVGGVKRTSRSLNKNKMLSKLPQLSKDCSTIESKSRDEREHKPNNMNQTTGAKGLGGQRHSSPSILVAMRFIQRANVAGCPNAIELMTPVKEGSRKVLLDPSTKALLRKAERMSIKCKELEAMHMAAIYDPSSLTPDIPSFQSAITESQQPTASPTVTGGNTNARVIRRSTSKISADDAKSNETHASQSQNDKKSQRLNRQISRQLSRQVSLESSPTPNFVKLDPNFQDDKRDRNSLKPSGGSTFDLFDEEAAPRPRYVKNSPSPSKRKQRPLRSGLSFGSDFDAESTVSRSPQVKRSFVRIKEKEPKKQFVLLGCENEIW